MGILCAVLAALVVALSNLCMQRSIDAGGSSRTYLVFQLFAAFFTVSLLNPIRAGQFTLHFPTLLLGACGGLVQGTLMWGIGKALERGPPGLSFAIFYTASIVPGVLLTSLFGTSYGYSYSLYNGIGSLLVIGGLFWAGRQKGLSPPPTWRFYVLLIFCTHALMLTFLGWWSLVLVPELPLSHLLPLHVGSDQRHWFAPAIMLVAALMHLALYVKNPPSQRIQKREIGYGILGGITSGGCNFFLVLAPQVASSWENTMIFPVFAVTAILLCNLWAQLLYQERVNWMANALCVTGLVVGTAF